MVWSGIDSVLTTPCKNEAPPFERTGSRAPRRPHKVAAKAGGADVTTVRQPWPARTFVKVEAMRICRRDALAGSQTAQNVSRPGLEPRQPSAPTAPLPGYLNWVSEEFPSRRANTFARF